jgi:hypothetical protein
MLLPLLVLLSAAPSSTVVVVTRRTAVPPADALAVATLVTRSLKDAKVVTAWEADGAARRLAALGVKDSSKCEGRLACVQEFGRQLDVVAVVSVSISELDRERSVTLEVVDVASGETLAKESLL